MLKHTFFLLLSMLSLASCKSGKDAVLSFGSGGGFTGASQQYLLSAKGTLVQYNSLSKDSIQLGEVHPKQVKYFFSEAKRLGIDTVQFNNPGNMYRFLEFSEKGKSNRVTWSQGSKMPPAGYEALYDSLQAIIPSKTATQ